MKKIFKKVLTIFILSILIISLITKNVEASSTQKASSMLEIAGGGFVGLLINPWKLIPVAIGAAIGGILGIASGSGLQLTMNDILFNQIKNSNGEEKSPLLNVSFFEASSNSTAQTLRDNVAIWYTSIRNIAVVLLVIIAIYVGIRMAISTIAEDQAKYKKMLIDWLTSLALLIILQYLMIIIIDINDSLVAIISTSLDKNNEKDLSDIAVKLVEQTFSSTEFVKGMTNAMAYLMLEVVTLIFFMIYIKRMITIAFLIIISPLVTVTYAIDKMQDGKSQALNTWLKEFSYNILIQPFHCVAYVALGGTAIKLLQGGFDSQFIGLIILAFIVQSEQIVKKIFHFESESLGTAVAHAALATTMLGGTTKALTGATKGAINGINSIKGSKKSKAPENENQDKSKENKKPKEKEAQGEQNDGEGNNQKTNENSESSGNNQSNQSNQNKNNGARKILRKAGNLYLRTGTKLALGLSGLAMGAATGDLGGAISGLKAGNDIASEINRNTKQQGIEHKLARDFNNYIDSTGKSSQEAINDGINLYDGTKNPTTEEEEDYAESIRTVADGLKASGVNDDDMKKALRKKLKSVSEGKVGEYGAVEKHFRGTIQKIKNKRTKNKYGNQ